MSSVIIVIPCYNEAARLQVQTFKAFACERHVLRFLFVNDGSTDDTWKVLQALHASNAQHLAIYGLPKNAGKAEAVRQGVLRAFEIGADYVGYWDADLATPLEAIPAFCDLLDVTPHLLMVFGARVRLLGRPSSAAPCGITSAGSLPLQPLWFWGSVSMTRNAAPSCSGRHPKSTFSSNNPSQRGGSSMSKSWPAGFKPVEARNFLQSKTSSTSFCCTNGAMCPALR